MGCSLANIGQCLPESFMNYLLGIFNAPLQPLLGFVQKLFTEPVDVAGYKDLWLVIVSVLGLFYGLAFLYAGFNFIIAGFDASRKDAAKTWLKSIIMMLVMVQASFWLYQLLVEIGALLTAGVYSLISPDFFRLTPEFFNDIGMSLLMTATYAVVLLVTTLLLILRYILVACGVMIFPVALFLYFLPPLRGLGQLLLWLCGTVIFMPFFASVGLLMASKLVTLEIFAGYKMTLMIGAFTVANLSLFGLLLFAVVKSAFSLLDINLHQSVSTALSTVNTVGRMKGAGSRSVSVPRPPRPTEWDASGHGGFASDST